MVVIYINKRNQCSINVVFCLLC